MATVATRTCIWRKGGEGALRSSSALNETVVQLTNVIELQRDPVSDPSI